MPAGGMASGGTSASTFAARRPNEARASRVCNSSSSLFGNRRRKNATRRRRERSDSRRRLSEGQRGRSHHCDKRFLLSLAAPKELRGKDKKMSRARSALQGRLYAHKLASLLFTRHLYNDKMLILAPRAVEAGNRFRLIFDEATAPMSYPLQSPVAQTGL